MKKTYEVEQIKRWLKNNQKEWRVYESEEESVLVHRESGQIKGRLSKTEGEAFTLFAEAPHIIDYLLSMIDGNQSKETMETDLDSAFIVFGLPTIQYMTADCAEVGFGVNIRKDDLRFQNIDLANDDQSVRVTFYRDEENGTVVEFENGGEATGFDFRQREVDAIMRHLVVSGILREVDEKWRPQRSGYHEKYTHQYFPS